MCCCSFIFCVFFSNFNCVCIVKFIRITRRWFLCLPDSIYTRKTMQKTSKKMRKIQMNFSIHRNRNRTLLKCILLYFVSVVVRRRFKRKYGSSLLASVFHFFVFFFLLLLTSTANTAVVCLFVCLFSSRCWCGCCVLCVVGLSNHALKITSKSTKKDWWPPVVVLHKWKTNWIVNISKRK